MSSSSAILSRGENVSLKNINIETQKGELSATLLKNKSCQIDRKKGWQTDNRM